MPSWLRYTGQAVLYGAFALVVGFFADSPLYERFPNDQALIRISINHGGAPVRECRRLTPEEIAALPPNMRRPTDCPRARMPLLVQLSIDGTVIYNRSVPPSGLFDDGPSRVYQKFRVASGPHQIAVKMRDSRREQGFDYEETINIDLAPRQNFVIDFRQDKGGFIFN